MDSDPVAKEILDLAQPLEVSRERTRSAAGVVIGAGPLIDVVPSSRAPTGKS